MPTSNSLLPIQPISTKSCLHISSKTSFTILWQPYLPFLWKGLLIHSTSLLPRLHKLVQSNLSTYNLRPHHIGPVGTWQLLQPGGLWGMQDVQHWRAPVGESLMLSKQSMSSWAGRRLAKGTAFVKHNYIWWASGFLSYTLKLTLSQKALLM